MSQQYTTISKEGIEYLCGLINKLANVSEGIDDLNLRTDGTFSSVKIDTLLNTLKTDCNEYTDRLVANLSRLELKIATSESEITQPNTMYLYKPSGSTSYEQYVVIEGTKVLLGTTDINMGDYYTITQADAKFVLKTDFDSLKTKVDGKVDKTDIIDNLASTDTDKPLSANQGKALNDGKIDKTDIATAISNTPSDDKVLSEKATKTELDKKADKSYVDDNFATIDKVASEIEETIDFSTPILEYVATSEPSTDVYYYTTTQKTMFVCYVTGIDGVPEEGKTDFAYSRIWLSGYNIIMCSVYVDGDNSMGMGNSCIIPKGIQLTINLKSRAGQSPKIKAFAVE